MSSDIFKMVCSMNRNSVEMQLAVQCAPLLAGLKISNLFIISDDNEQAFYELMSESNLSVYLLTKFNKKIAYLIFCRKELEMLLAVDEIQEFFRRQGYGRLDVDSILVKFKGRYEQHIQKGGAFPHEMGLILGYPIEDVEGFIENGGNNSLYTGYWKVYKKPEEKKLIFQSYEHATEKIIKLLYHGVEMSDIIRVTRRQHVAV